MLAEWSGDYRARDRDQRAGRSPPAGGSGSRTSWSGRTGSSARRTAASGDYGRALARSPRRRTSATASATAPGRAGSQHPRLVPGEIGATDRARDYNERAAAHRARARRPGDHLQLRDQPRDQLARARRPRPGAAYLDPIAPALEPRATRGCAGATRCTCTTLVGRAGARARGDPERGAGAAAGRARRRAPLRAPKVEARALVLRGEALLAMDARDAAEAALLEAVRIADPIELSVVARGPRTSCWPSWRGARGCRRGRPSREPPPHAPRRGDRVAR